jgi:hypothetical protein
MVNRTTSETDRTSRAARKHRRILRSGRGPSINLIAARRRAQHYVDENWPELARAEPVVTPQIHFRPGGELLARLNQSGEPHTGEHPARGEHTFTFVGECHTGDGAPAPLIVVVTVDRQQRIVKTSVSK